MELDRIPLWRGDHIELKQLAEDFARYNYLPRLSDTAVLIGAVRDGVSLITWAREGFAYADTYDETAGRYRGLRGGHQIPIGEDDLSGVLVKPEVASNQLQSEASLTKDVATPTTESIPPGSETVVEGPSELATSKPKRYYGSVELDAHRVGRDAGRIADEVIGHLAGLDGARVRVTLEIEAELSSGAPDNVVRTVTENSQTLKFKTHGFERE